MRHNEEEIQLGIQLFRKLCPDASRVSNGKGQFLWKGETCEGGGAVLLHKMNEDSMTPSGVASYMNVKSILGPAKEAYQKSIHSQTLEFLQRK